MPSPTDPHKGHSARRINRLNESLIGLDSYLEIGVFTGATLEQVAIPRCVGVDPNPLFDLDRLPKHIRVEPVVSDAFFQTCTEQFDLVFVDGLHVFDQAYRDAINGFSVVGARIVLIDDVVPSDPASAIPEQSQSLTARSQVGLPGTPWHGDVFKLLRVLSDHHPELHYRTILGSGNPQALVWRTDLTREVSHVGQQTLDEYSGDDFAHVFRNGVPGYFNPSGEDSAIADALTALAPWYR